MADAYVTSAAASVGSSGLRAVPTLVHNGFLKWKRAQGRIVTACNTEVTRELVTGPGQTINVIKASHPSTTSTLTDGNAIVMDDSVETGAQVTLSTFRYTVIGKTQIAQKIANPAAWAALIAGRTAKLMNDIEAAVTGAAYSGFTTNSTGTSGTSPSADVFTTAHRKLFDAYAPNEDVHGFLAPSAYKAVLDNTTLVSATNRGQMTQPSPIMTGGAMADQNVLDLYGVPYSQAQTITTATVSTHTETRNLVFHRDALLFVSAPLPQPLFAGGVILGSTEVDGIALTTIYQWQPGYISEQILIGCLYGVAVGREEWGCTILS